MRILIADDHLIVRQGMQMLLQELFSHAQFTHVSSIAQLLNELKMQVFDLLVLDAQFPEGTSIGAVSEIREIQPNLKILIFTSFEEEHYGLKFINAGANGFLSKLSEENEIKDAFTKLMQNGYFYSDITGQLLSLSRIAPHLSNPLSLLSDRELEVARLLSEGFGNLEIANQLNVKQNTVSTFKKRIFEKLKIDSLVALTELVRIHRQ